MPLAATHLADGSCAAWTPPDTPPWPSERSERFTAVLDEVCTADDERRLAVLDAAMEAEHPRERHWYLGVIATRPDARNKGRGTSLLSASLRAVDDDTLPAYLESTNPRNISLYERHGFAAIGTIELPDGPTLTRMWRPPAHG